MARTDSESSAVDIKLVWNLTDGRRMNYQQETSVIHCDYPQTGVLGTLVDVAFFRVREVDDRPVVARAISVDITAPIPIRRSQGISTETNVVLQPIRHRTFWNSASSSALNG